MSRHDWYAPRGIDQPFHERTGPKSGAVTAFITGLLTGDHPTEQREFKDGWI